MSSGLRHSLLLLVATAGLAGSLLMAQVILSHHNWRLDLTPEKRFTLSEHAQKVLAGLDRNVQIIAFLRSDDARNSEVEDLLRRLHNASHHVRYDVVDVNRNPAVARQYGVDNYGSLVVESEGRRKEFANPREDLLIEAILQVTRPARKVIYFVTGHGEQDLRSNDRHNGYSAIRAALQSEFYEVLPLSLMGEGGVPADANAVVIAGARKDLLPTELGRLTAYAERGGSLLIMLEPAGAPSLRAFLGRYGVKAEDGVVVDPDNRLFAGDYLTITVPGLSERHPVSAALKAPPLFSHACAVAYVGPAAGVRGIEFLETAPSSWRTTDPEVLRTGVATFDRSRDQQGPIPVGASLLVELPGQSGPKDNGVAAARFIILGDSNFANNFFIEYLGDKDLLVNSINWLAGEQELVGERPQLRQPGINQFFVSARQGRMAFVLGTIAEPALVLIIGATIFLRRRWGG
jgi:ABC-type uncharacterized transport system involved in gliding motility auxiliary subunit